VTNVGVEEVTARVVRRFGISSTPPTKWMSQSDGDPRRKGRVPRRRVTVDRSGGRNQETCFVCSQPIRASARLP